MANLFEDVASRFGYPGDKTFKEFVGAEQRPEAAPQPESQVVSQVSPQTASGRITIGSSPGLLRGQMAARDSGQFPAARGGEDVSTGRPYAPPDARRPTGQPSGDGVYPGGVNAAPALQAQGPVNMTNAAYNDGADLNAPFREANREFDLSKNLETARLGNEISRQADDSTRRAAGPGYRELEMARSGARVDGQRAAFGQFTGTTRQQREAAVRVQGRAGLDAGVLAKMEEANRAAQGGAPRDFLGDEASIQKTLGEAGQTANRDLLAKGQFAKYGAESEALRAGAAATTEQAKGYAIDRTGKLIDNKGKVVGLELLTQQIQSGKLDLAGKEQLNALTAQLNNPKLSQEQRSSVENSILVAYGKDPKRYAVEKTNGPPVFNPSTGQVVPGEQVVHIINIQTGRPEVTLGGAAKAAIPPQGAIDQLRKNKNNPRDVALFEQEYGGEGMANKYLGQ